MISLLLTSRLVIYSIFKAFYFITVPHLSVEGSAGMAGCLCVSTRSGVLECHMALLSDNDRGQTDIAWPKSYTTLHSLLRCTTRPSTTNITSLLELLTNLFSDNLILFI